MPVVDRGTGAAVVLVPGIQGRWEYVRPTVDALADVCRVLTFSVCGERGSDCRFAPQLGYDNYVEQIDRALDRCGVPNATVAGVSAGGRIALRYAAERPGRVNGLVLVSTPSPGWKPDERLARYVRSPRRSTLPFLLGSPSRLYPEIRAALPGHVERGRFLAWQLKTLVVSPLSMSRMAGRARLMAETDQTADCARILVPTLLVVGERALDRVVPLDETLEYVRLITGAQVATVERTGHLGTITRPRVFAGIVRGFLEGLARGARARSEVA